MSEFSGFFDAHKVSGNWDRTYVAAEFARYFASFVGNGVFAGQSNELQVIQSNPQGMAVTVASGKAWIDGYMYYNDADLVLPIDNADGTLNRIDTIVCRWSSVDRTIKAYVKKGIAAVNPTVPAIQWDADIKELQLASIKINAGIVSVIQSSITDTRPNSNVCGWVTGIINQVDTATLFLQWQDAYNQEFLNTQTYIAQQKALWDAFFGSVSEDIGLIDGSVTTSKLANQAVTADKLAPDSVTTDKLVSNAVTTGKLANRSVTADKLASDAIKLLFTNVSVSAASFVPDSTYADYPYRASIALSGVTTAMIPEVVFGLSAIANNSFAPVAECYNGGVYIYAADAPETAISIPTIICWR